MTAAPEPSDALVEAMARRMWVEEWKGEGVTQEQIRSLWADEVPAAYAYLARAAYAAMAEHLGLVEGTSGRLIATRVPDA